MSPPIFTFLGFLKDWKGVDLLLYAASIALKQELLQLRIIGDGSIKKELELLTYQLGISKQVQFLGFVPQEQCPSLLQESRALVLPSLFECGGAVVLEAMAVGIPVIATRWGGPVDYVTENCGILIEPSSKAAFIRGLAEAMVRLARDERLAEQMGQQGRKRVESLFSWQAKIEQIMKIYETVAKNYKN